MRTFMALSSALLVLSCGPKPASTGPYTAWLLLERWHRADPSNEYTMTGLITFHRDERLPRVVDVDAHCSVAYGHWGQTDFRPPTYGAITMKIADRAEVAWKEDSEGVGIDWPNGQLQWDSGDTLAVTSAGAELPAFSLEATVPPQVLLTSHALPALKANELHLSRSTPLELRWEPTSGDVLLMVLQFPALNSLARERFVTCTWPASTGAATVPSAVLEHLKVSTAGLNTNIYFGGAVQQTLSLDGVDVKAFAFKNEVARVQVDN